MTRILIAALLALVPSLAMAQTDRNPPILVKTQPPGTANNTAASTAFVANAVSGIGGGGGITDAPSDSVYYVRRNAGWVQMPASGVTSSAVTTALGYTPANKAGDTLTGLYALTGDMKMLPQGSPTLMGAHNPANTPQPEGFFITPSGPYVDFCSIGGCFDGPRLLAAADLNVTTKKGASAQEVGLHINFAASTGRITNWAAHTAYNAGDFVSGGSCTDTVGGSLQNLGGCNYRAVTSGTSGSTMPSGNSSSITDGSVTWAWEGGGANNGKSAFSVAATFDANAGAGWGYVLDVGTSAGYLGPVYGEEKDCNNGTSDSYAGASPFWVCTFYGGGGAGTFPLFASIYSGSGAVNSGSGNPYGAHNGWFISGQPGDVGSTYQDAVIADFGNSTFTLQGGAGRSHQNFIRDDSNSTGAWTSLSGTHSAGIDMGGATISGGMALKMPSSTFLDWGEGGFLTWNGSIAAFTLGGSTSGTAYSLGVYNTGDVAVGRHLGQRGGSKPNLSSCGSSSLSTYATDVSGIINIQAGLTACNINFGAGYSQEADCVFSGSGGTPPAWGNSNSGYALSFGSAPSGLKISYVCMGQ